MSKINNYLPKVLQPIIELQQINADLDVELTNIDKLIKDIEKETIVQTATEFGISKWERILGIVPADSDSLEVRRFRISNILTSKLPYTVRWLQRKLTEIVGSVNGWTLAMNYREYTITIVLSGLDTKLMLEVEKQLRNAIPANMKLIIGGPNLTSSVIKIGIGMMWATKNNIVSIVDPNIAGGKNLIKFTDKTSTYNGVTEVIKDGVVTFSGTLTNGTTRAIRFNSLILIPGTYTLGITVDKGSQIIRLEDDAQKTIVQLNPTDTGGFKTFTITAPTRLEKVIFVMDTKVTLPGTLKVQLERGNVKTEWEKWKSIMEIGG